MTEEVFCLEKTRFFPSSTRHLGGPVYLVTLPYRRHGDTEDRFVYLRYESEHLKPPLERLVVQTPLQGLSALLKPYTDQKVQQAIRALQREARQSEQRLRQQSEFPTLSVEQSLFVPEYYYNTLHEREIGPVLERVRRMKNILKQRQQQFVLIPAQAPPVAGWDDKPLMDESYFTQEGIRWPQARQPLGATQGVQKNDVVGKGDQQGVEQSVIGQIIRDLKQKISSAKDDEERQLFKAQLERLQGGSAGAMPAQQQQQYTRARAAGTGTGLRVSVYLSRKPVTDDFFRRAWLSFDIPLKDSDHHRFLEAHAHLTDVLRFLCSILYSGVPRIGAQQKSGVRGFLEIGRLIAPVKKISDILLTALDYPLIASNLRALAQGASNIETIRIFLREDLDQYIWLMKYAKGIFSAVFT